MSVNMITFEPLQISSSNFPGIILWSKVKTSSKRAYTMSATNHGGHKVYRDGHCNENVKTRMVQLPATAAIEYVAACLPRGHFFPGGTFGWGDFWQGGFLSGGSFARGTFSPGVFCPGALLAGGTFGRGDFCPGVLLSGGLLPEGTFVRGAYARSPQVQCVYAPSRLSVPSIVA